MTDGAILAEIERTIRKWLRTEDELYGPAEEPGSKHRTEAYRDMLKLIRTLRKRKPKAGRGERAR